VLRSHYRQVIRIHEERHKQKDERLANLISKADSASPEELLVEVRRLAKQQQRMVTAEQWQAISEFLRTIPYDERRRLSFINIKFPYQDLEAEKYAEYFARVFDGTTSKDGKIGLEVTGLIIRVRDTGVVPLAARDLSAALKAASIGHRISSLELQFPIAPSFDFELVIGRND